MLSVHNNSSLQKAFKDMDKLCFKISLICIALTSSLTKVYALECQNGSVCVALNECNTAYQNILNINIKQLIKGLSCGFEGELLKVCCPPLFREENNLLPNSTVCGIQTNERIFGGEKTDIDEHPWMALLRYDKPKGHGYYCGGVLISSRYVLTAAHCLIGAEIPRSWRLSQVRLGEWNLTSETDCRSNDCSLPVVDVPIESLIPHEGYKPKDGNQQNDIALIRLAKEVQFTDFVKPICLPITDELQKQSYVGWDMEVAGWGKTEKRSMSDVKLKVSLPVINQEECKDVYSSASRVITEKQICAGGLEGQDSCRGDSGGSLMGQASVSKNWFAFGVVSYGPSPCGTLGWPGVYTRVTAFTDWILSNIKP